MNNGVEILIAEDSPTQAEQLRRLLEEHGYRVTVAANGKKALAEAKKRKPTLIISDIVMPVMDGYTFCKKVKSDETLKDTPVVLLTGLSSQEDVIKGLECNADNFIRKPYDERYLLSRIKHILTNRELRNSERMQLGVMIYLAGQKHFITSERQQILDLLISTYEQAVHINKELSAREQELSHANQWLTGLYQIAKGLIRCTSEQEVVEEVLDRALKLPGVQAGWIALREGETGFRIVGARGLPPPLEVPGAMEGDCLCRRKLLSGELNQATSILECERLQKATGDTRGLRLHASVPLWIGERTLGILNLVGAQDGLISGESLKILNGVGNQVCIALERARLHEHLESMVEQRTAALTAEIAERTRAQESLAARAHQQAAVADVGQRALAGTDLSRLMDEAAALVSRTLDIEYCSVLELLPDGHALLLRVGVGWKDGCVGRVTLSAGAGSHAGYTLLCNAPVVVEDLSTETRFSVPPILLDHGVVSGVSVIIQGREDRPFGVLGTHTRRRRTFTQDDIHFLQAIANVLAMAIERTRTEAIRQALYQASLQIQEPLRLQERLDRLLQTAQTVLALDRINILLADKEGQELRAVASLGVDEPLDAIRVPIGAAGGALAEAYRTHQMIIWDGQAPMPEAYRLKPPFDQIAALRSRVFAIVPLVVQGRAIGVLGVDRKHSRRALEPAMLELLQLFASQAALAIEHGRLYEAQRLAAIQLEATVEARTRELQATNRRLEEASRHKSEFLANMSHELRTPLNSVIGFSELLLEQTVGQLNEKQTRFLTNVQNSGKHLVQLINDILDLSKVEAGKVVLHVEPLPVAMTLEDILVIARGLAHKKRQTVETQIDPDLPPLQADPLRFKQILFNLLSNAIKFTPDGGRVLVTARRVPRSTFHVPSSEPGTRDLEPGTAGVTEFIEIAVADTGIGIKAEDLPRLFQEFMQLEAAATKRYEGTGLGLALTRRLVELHGGRIWAESAGQGRGSTFTFALPFAGPGETADASAGAPT